MTRYKPYSSDEVHCGLFPFFGNAMGGCWACGGPLGKGRRHWCGDACEKDYWRQHLWNWASNQARREQDACEDCGVAQRDGYRGPGEPLEVHHIVPTGGDYRPGCQHHRSNLRVLCIPCHRKADATIRKYAKRLQESEAGGVQIAMGAQ